MRFFVCANGWLGRRRARRLSEAVSAATLTAMHSDHDDDEPKGLWPTIHSQSGVILGVIGLVAWCAMIWFMFGDVL